MSTPPPAFAPAPVVATATAAEDLGPLAWVLGEIQKSLDGAGKLLRRFARETGSVPEIDGGPLRLARAQLHQAVGALQMVGHAAPARVLGAMEFAVQSFVLEPMRCTDAAVLKVERAGLAVADFLQALLAGKQVSPIALFAQYRDVLELVGNERVHPADLWPQPWRWADISRSAASTTRCLAPPTLTGRPSTMTSNGPKARTNRAPIDNPSLAEHRPRTENLTRLPNQHPSDYRAV